MAVNNGAIVELMPFWINGVRQTMPTIPIVRGPIVS